ncbi:extracellular calcium-sensing receptor-like [Engystomops pustulosus]|uniref:extracellular calcium-sensing receptor-like n=1 Tax=Engystomops pustulosus TaxID=76066 RepID=UPI003AFAC243
MIGVGLPINSDKVFQKFTFNVPPPKTTCRLFNLEYYHRFQTFLFTVGEVNTNILSNVTLGYQMYDTCNIPHFELQGALQFLTDSRTSITDSQCKSRPLFTVAVGATASANSILLAHFLGTFRYPQISPFSSVSILSDRKMFPSFFRTLSSDLVQSKGLAQLILSFGWTWIGLVALDSDYGLQGIQPIKEEIVRAGACVAFIEYILLGQPDRNVPHIVRTIKESTATVVVVFSTEVEILLIVNEMMKQNISGKIFVGNAGWTRSTLLSKSQYFPVLSGSLGLAMEEYAVPGLSQFLAKIHPNTSTPATWTKMYWENVFSCQFRPENQTFSSVNPVKMCTGAERLEDIKNSSNYISSLKTTHFIFAAVHVIAKALEDLRSCKMGEGPFFNGTCANILNFRPWQLTYYIRRVQLNINVDSENSFNTFYNWQLKADGTTTNIGMRTSIVNEGWTLRTISYGGLLVSNARKYKEGEKQRVNEGRIESEIITSKQKERDGQTFVQQLVDIDKWETTPFDRKSIKSKITDQRCKMTRNRTCSYLQVPISQCSNSCAVGFRKAALQGRPTCCYACAPCLQGEISNQTDSVNCFRCPWDEWPNPEKSKCLPKTIQFLSYDDILGASLAATSILSSSIPAVICGLFIHYKHTPLVKASNYSLSCLLLQSLSLCFFCSLGFIGYPDHDRCLLRQVSFGLVFTLCVACILAKTIMVVFAFMATKPGSNLRKWTTLKVSYTIILICFLLQLVLCITWMSVAPPFPQYNLEAKPGLIIVECNDGSPVAFWAMLGYLFLLATISFIVAFLARKLPDSFNEAQFITFSMLAFLSVWISFIPASLSAEGKYTVAMEVFAILASSWAVLICMFFPKCYILLFRPEMNSKDYLTMRNKDKSLSQATFSWKGSETL